MLESMQIWAREPTADPAAPYSGSLTALRAVDTDGQTRRLRVLDADPMIAMSGGLLEEFFEMQLPVRLLDTLRIDAEDGPVVYIVRGIDTDTDTYYLSWPD